jgi:hypothetical protein
MTIESILVGILAAIVIFTLIHITDRSPYYREGDYVMWWGALYKITKVEGKFLIVEDTLPLKRVYLIETDQPILKKVSKEFAEKYLSLKKDK